MAKRSVGSDGIAISPVLLAGVLAVLWVAVLAPSDSGDLGAPEWGMPVLVATRLLAGFAVGWVVISLAQIALRAVWIGAQQVLVWSRRP